MNLHFYAYQDEDGWFIAECPALPGCVTQAKTEPELIQNMKEAMMAWFAAEDAKAVEQAKHDRADEFKDAKCMTVVFA